ncbi:MAG: ABC transporter permease [Thiomonas sp. 20-64-9]|jgi:molybdate transport system permease protein|uniref:molybdate ABC transporter permease subunit n=1 Tax=unclassified Thiomonas TaxID=2625466 RepID=UPI000BD8C165|nr:MULTISPECIES: ABC transporter permease subunit [unclassified Thiomonas]OYV30507.1 MAG: ABC transporter permease [Thiomonas sp. 20-64-9]OZB69526.1 MAG: ABC transporter permease [Thiomonas sp. 13-64-67]
MSVLTPDAVKALWLSVRIALLVLPAYAAAAVVLGYALQFGLRRPAWLDALITIPLVFPPVVIGFALLWLLGRESLLGRALQLVGVNFVFTFPGLLLAAFIAGLPLAVKTLQTALQTHPRVWHEVALTLGRGPVNVYLTMHLPIALPALLGGLLLALARGMGEVGISLMLGGNILGRTETLSLAIFNTVTTGDYAQAAWLSALLGGFSLVLFVAVRLLQNKELAKHDVFHPG